MEITKRNFKNKYRKNTENYLINKKMKKNMEEIDTDIRKKRINKQ